MQLSKATIELLNAEYPLTDSQIAEYQRDGFTVIDDILTGEALAEVRDAIADAVAVESVGRAKDVQQLGVYERIFNQKVNLWSRHDTVRAISLCPRFATIAGRLEQRAMRIWHDQALFKEPGGNVNNKTPWHQDAPYWPHDDRAHSTTIWLALKEANRHNGCMTFIPKTHLREYQAIDLGIPDDLFEFAPEFKGIKGEMRELKAGSATYHNGLTFHYAGPNHSTGTREAFAVIYMPDGTAYRRNPHVVTDPLALQDGAMLDGELFPLVARRGS